MIVLSRRSFIKTSALAAAGSALSPRSWAQVPGANSDVRLAVIGCDFPGGRGQNHLKSFGEVPGLRIAAICDVDTVNLERTKAALKQKGTDVETFVDFRDVLARADIDAVSIATPNHLHALVAIWACQAGKDVYLEKPISHNVWEGRQVVRAAARYGRVVEAGMQCRSSTSLAEAAAWIQAGNLGKIRVARGLCYKRRDSIGLSEGPQSVPSTVNYDLWLGPAPMEAPRRKRFHYEWHWFWATGNGDLGNQGIHQMDIARWFLGEPGIAAHTLSVGGRLGYTDDGETPNTQVIVHDYARAPLVFEVRGLTESASSTTMDRYPSGKLGASIGVVVECEGGNLVIPDYTSAHAYDTKGQLLKSFSGATSHFQNFIDVVRSRRLADLKAPIAEGHVSSALCHTGNVSQKLGAELQPDALREHIRGNSAMSEAFGRMSEHLARHQVDLGRTPALCGLPLHFNPDAERFVDNDAANALLTRDYRKPFVVPDLA